MRATWHKVFKLDPTDLDDYSRGRFLNHLNESL
jgi:hypothetical protein